MREFLSMATAGSGTASITGAVSGQTTIAAISLVFMILFGLWGAWLKWRDSRAIRKALESGDLVKAIEIRNK